MVSVVRAHDLLVLSMNHVLPVTSDSRVEWGGEMQYGLWRLLSERKKGQNGSTEGASLGGFSSCFFSAQSLDVANLVLFL